MSYFDSPGVDDNSKKSEESVLKVKTIFTRRNGFISREETPDYGVDLDIELVYKDEDASSNKFAVQIKSTQKINLKEINGEKFIALSFKTSRLGYLSKRAPAFGLIVLYEEESENCYFDYVEDIITRITNFQGNDNWKLQESVTILIPNKILDLKSAKLIHDKFSLRFKNHDLLLFSQGSNYDIPVLNTITKQGESIDFNNPKQVVEFLEQYGGLLYNNHDYDFLISLLSNLPKTYIDKSKELLFLTAITYGQIGNVIEASYYLSRCYQRIEEFDKESKVLLDFTKIRTDFLKGNLDINPFMDELSRLIYYSNNDLNLLTFRINLIHLKLLNTLENGEKDSTIRNLIEDLFQTIEGSSLDEKDKNLLKLFHSESLHTYGLNLFLKDASKFKIQEKLGLLIPMDIRVKRVNAILPLIEKAIKYAHEVYSFGKTIDDNLLMAQALSHLGKYFLGLQFNLFMISIDQKKVINENIKYEFGKNLNYILNAFNLFLKLGMLKDAHQTLSTAYEIKILFLITFDEEIGEGTVQSIETTLRKLENTLGLPPYISSVGPAIESLVKILNRPDSKLAHIPDGEEENFARKILEAYELPNNRLPNIIADIKNYKIFEKECQNQNIELLQDLRHLERWETKYLEPPIYILRSKISGIESKPSSDIYNLLSQFSSILKKDS